MSVVSKGSVGAQVAGMTMAERALHAVHDLAEENAQLRQEIEDIGQENLELKYDIKELGKSEASSKRKIQEMQEGMLELERRVAYRRSETPNVIPPPLSLLPRVGTDVSW